MLRLHMVVEGQTEETFVKTMLVEYLGYHNIVVDVRLVETSRRKATIYRGGMTNYPKVRKDLERWMREDGNPDAHFTTMFDLYRLPDDFPECAASKRYQDPYDRVRSLESAFKRDLDHPRFIPYIQLHEFEALLFSEPAQFNVVFVEERQAVRNLQAVRAGFKSPELIDDGATTAPSKRIIREIPAYEGQKSSAGPLIAAAIGLSTLQSECEHFRNWLEKLTGLDSTPL